MENKPKNFRIVNQYIKDLSFENKLAIDQKVSKIAPTPNIDLDIKTSSLGNQVHEVSLFCNVNSKVNDKTVYLIELVYCGICKIQDMPKLEMQNVLYSKVPSLSRRLGVKNPNVLKQLFSDPEFKEWSKKKLNNAECRILKIGEKRRRKKTTPVVVEQTSLEDFIW